VTSACFLAQAACGAVLSNQPLLALMEHSCHKCGQPVEDGVPFCAHCAAPQIRVAIVDAGPGQSISAVSLPNVDASVASAGPDRTAPSQIIDWAQALPAAAVAGMIASVGMMFVGLLGLWMLAAGFLSVLFYRRRTRGGMLFPRAGARLGSTAGLLGFAIFAFVTVPTGLFRSMMLELVRQAQRSNPQLQALTERWLDLLKTPEGLAAFLAVLFVFLIIAAAVGGALGGALLSRGGRHQGPFSSN